LARSYRVVTNFSLSPPRSTRLCRLR
jgi:hypothetical protein